MNGLNWHWISIELTVAPLLGLLVAFPFWRKGGMIFGNIVGTALIFGWAFALIFREHIESIAMVRQCLEDGMVCWPEPSAFTRYGDLRVYCADRSVRPVLAESRRGKKLRDRDYAPEWR